MFCLSDVWIAWHLSGGSQESLPPWGPKALHSLELERDLARVTVARTAVKLGRGCETWRLGSALWRQLR